MWVCTPCTHTQTHSRTHTDCHTHRHMHADACTQTHALTHPHTERKTDRHIRKMIRKQRQLQQRASQSVKIPLVFIHYPFLLHGALKHVPLCHRHRQEMGVGHIGEVDPQPHETPDKVSMKKLERTELSRQSRWHPLTVPSVEFFFCFVKSALTKAEDLNFAAVSKGKPADTGKGQLKHLCHLMSLSQLSEGNPSFLYPGRKFTISVPVDQLHIQHLPYTHADRWHISKPPTEWKWGVRPRKG